MPIWGEVVALTLAAYGLGLVTGWLLMSAPVRIPRRKSRSSKPTDE